MTGPEEPDGEQPAGQPGFEDHLWVFFREPTLWPVLLVALLIFTTLGAALLVLALGDRNLFALAALAVVVLVSVDVVVRNRLGLVSRVVLGLWCAAAALALAALRFLR
jgi:D-serine dehydratase